MESEGVCSSGISIVCNGNACVFPETPHGDLPGTSSGSGSGVKLARRKRRTVSVDQREKMISALETWTKSPEEYQVKIRRSWGNENAWQDLSSTLNQMGEDKRSPKDWKLVWAQMKSSAKRKEEKVKRLQETPSKRSKIRLSRRDTRVLSLAEPRDPHISPPVLTPKIEPRTPVDPFMESMDVPNDQTLPSFQENFKISGMGNWTNLNQELPQDLSRSGSSGSPQILDEHSYASLQGPYTERELQLFKHLDSARLEIQRLQKEKAFLKDVLLNNYNMLKDAIVRV